MVLKPLNIRPPGKFCSIILQPDSLSKICKIIEQKVPVGGSDFQWFQHHVYLLSLRCVKKTFPGTNFSLVGIMIRLRANMPQKIADQTKVTTGKSLDNIACQLPLGTARFLSFPERIIQGKSYGNLRGGGICSCQDGQGLRFLTACTEEINRLPCIGKAAGLTIIFQIDEQFYFKLLKFHD